MSNLGYLCCLGVKNPVQHSNWYYSLLPLRSPAQNPMIGFGIFPGRARGSAGRGAQGRDSQGREPSIYLKTAGPHARCGDEHRLHGAAIPPFI